MAIKKIKKRDGALVRFEPKKIASAIWRALAAVNVKEAKVAGRLADEVVALVNRRWKGKIPTVEAVQDVVEEVLIKNRYPQAAKAYILYRHKRREIREVKELLGVKDELKLSVNAVRVLQRRYLLKDERGNVVETPAQMFRRVAKAVAAAERKYGERDVRKIEEQFYRAMTRLEFLPNSPTLMNAGTPLGQLSACFALPVEDSIKDIFEATKQMAVIFQSGGGVGYSFSRIRPKGDIVQSTHGVASGPISFMRIFDVATEVIKQGGKRRGANMGILSVGHPDILEFVEAKSKPGLLENFNLSVAVNDNFMDAAKHNRDYGLINPHTGKIVRKMSARAVFDLIVTMAWETGDPGMIFLDEINRRNPTPKLGRIETTNPCGELPLLPYESCNLGSVNLAKFAEGGSVNWKKLRDAVHLGVRFLDDVIDVTRFPLPEIERMTKANRKIGLGIMGFADALVQLSIPYDSERAIEFAENLMRFVSREAKEASRALARRRGPFPNFKGSIYDMPARRSLGVGGPASRKLRNATTTTIAPTGSISIIANASSGIEPIFALSFVRNIMEGARLLEVNPYFEKLARGRGFYSSDLMMKIARSGSVKGMKEVPKSVKRVFVTAFDIAPQWHVRMQAAFQRYTDNSVSKTINFPPQATVDDVRKAYLMAHALKCKGITVYRYGSKKEQVLYLQGAPVEKMEPALYVSAESEYAGGCPSGACPF